MVNTLSDAEYFKCVPSTLAQRVFASILFEDAKVQDSLNKIVIIGISPSGEIIAEEIARRLRRPCYVLPDESSSLPWLPIKEDIREATALLIDSVMVSPRKFEAAVGSLSLSGITRVIPFTPLLNKEVLLGNAYPLKRGVFWKTFENSQDLCAYIDPINKIDNAKEVREALLSDVNLTDRTVDTNFSQ